MFRTRGRRRRRRCKVFCIFGAIRIHVTCAQAVTPAARAVARPRGMRADENRAPRGRPSPPDDDRVPPARPHPTRNFSHIFRVTCYCLPWPTPPSQVRAARALVVVIFIMIIIIIIIILTHTHTHTRSDFYRSHVPPGPGPFGFLIKSSPFVSLTVTTFRTIRNEMWNVRVSYWKRARYRTTNACIK